MKHQIMKITIFPSLFLPFSFTLSFFKALSLFDSFTHSLFLYAVLCMFQRVFGNIKKYLEKKSFHIFFQNANNIAKVYLYNHNHYEQIIKN